jgi:hypothetical protein
MSNRKVVNMYRDEAVKLMTDTIDEFNRYQALQNNMSSDQIEEYIKQNRDQLEFVNGMLYDVLKSNGVII